VEDRLKGRKLRRTKEKEFHIRYGDSAVEAFNVFSQYDMKRIQSLVDCISSEDGRFLHSHNDALSGAELKGRYGGSNVTRLNGLFSVLLPDVYQNLMDSIRRALESTEWGENDGFGVRSVEYLSFEKSGLQDHLLELQKKQEAKKREKSVFVIGPVSSNSESAAETEEEYYHLHEHLLSKTEHQYARSFSLFKIFALFSNREEFYGGDIVIDEESFDLKDVAVQEYEDDDQSHTTRFNFIKRKVDTVTLEKSNIVIVNGKFNHGLEIVKFGQREGMLIELWKFRDSPITPRLLSFEEGLALGSASVEHSKNEL
jgi:hypothetical protein